MEDKPSGQTLLKNPTIRAATASDEAAVFDVIVLAFSADPVARWTWSDPQQYLVNFSGFARAFGSGAFAHGSAYVADENAAGAALWLPPGVEPDEAVLIELLQSTASKQSQQHAFQVFAEMGRYHPTEPHWYLPLMGVDPFRQGQGLGSALMKHALVACDHDSCLAYLESTNPKNVPLYQRHGFELLGTIQVGTSPPLFPMLRKPRTRAPS